MKLSKVIMTVAAAAAVIGFAGCKNGDDDPNEMISGKNTSYSIAYTNSSTSVSRGYKDTAYKHAGAAVQLDFTSLTSDTTNAGVMGLIFDLTTTDGKRSFDVIGVKTSDTTGGLKYYVSRFENVTDIQAQNFGAPETNSDGTQYAGNGASEKTYKTAWQTATGTNTNNTTTVYAYVIEKQVTESGTKDTLNNEIAANSYVYKVYLVNNTIAKLDKDGNLVDDNGGSVTLLDSDCLATIATGYTKLTQAKLAVYANVYGGKTLNGKWTYRGDYKYCGVDED